MDVVNTLWSKNIHMQLCNFTISILHPSSSDFKAVKATSD